MLEEGQKRKSARIAAIEAAKEDKKKTLSINEEEEEEKPETCQKNIATTSAGVKGLGSYVPDRRKSVKRKRLDEVTEPSSLPAIEQVGGEAARHENNLVTGGDRPSRYKMPEKNTLERVLDLLQKKDTYEIFAQPVDVAQVIGYSNIIKQPMDFGTIRARLQEEMYKTLEEFEFDVFLVSKNAMHFNAEATLFFKQARSINELSKKIFNILKNNPEKFVLEFPLQKNQPGRKSKTEAGSSHTTRCRRARPSKRLSLKHRVNQGEREKLSGAGNRKDVEFIDRRQSYTPYKNSLIENKPIMTIDNGPNLLLLGNGDISYEESLMRYSKGMGPTAQKVVLRMLSNLPPNYHQSQAQLPVSLPFPDTNSITSSAGCVGNFQLPSILSIENTNANDPLGNCGARNQENSTTIVAEDLKGGGVNGEKWTYGMDHILDGSRGGIKFHDPREQQSCSSLQGEKTVQPTKKNLFRCFINDSHQAKQNEKSPLSLSKPIAAFQCLDHSHTAGNQKMINQTGSYLSNGAPMNLHKNPTSGGLLGFSQYSNQVKAVKPVTSGLSASIFEATPRNVRSTKSSVYPSTYLRPAKSSRPTNLFDGLGLPTQTDASSSNPRYGPNAAQAQQESCIMGFYTKLMSLAINPSSQESLDIFGPDKPQQPVLTTKTQPLTFLTPLGRDLSGEQELKLALDSYMQTPDTEANLLCQNSWASTSASIPLGLSPFLVQDGQCVLGPNIVSRPNNVNLLNPAQSALVQQERQLMPPPGRIGQRSPEEETSFQHLWNFEEEPLLVSQQPDLALQLGTNFFMPPHGL